MSKVPVRLDAKAIRPPSGDQAAIRFVVGPKVSRWLVPWEKSCSHMSIAPEDPLLTAALVPSGDSATVLCPPGSPTVPRLFPARLNHLSSTFCNVLPVRYARTPFSEAENNPKL